VKTSRSLLIIADVEQQAYQTLVANKVKGNIKVNIVDIPGFGNTKADTLDDLAMLTGATVINEELGDDLDLIDPEVLGEVTKAVTNNKNTILQVDVDPQTLSERIEDVRKKVSEETNGYIKNKLEQRLSMLTGKVGIIHVGADSRVELKEKKDRVEDAIYATQAALKEGIVPGGGIALLYASQNIKSKGPGYKSLLTAIRSPFNIIMENANIKVTEPIVKKGEGINAITGERVDMIEAGIIDPVLVTKTALKNAISVATTIMSADCIISNMRLNESN
jgi:chaperonin GroEL